MTTKYTNTLLNDPSNNQTNTSFLAKEVINEEISIEILLNIKLNVCVDITERCSFREADFKLHESFQLKIGNDLSCTSKHCNLLCKWMMVKNSYLFSELNALQKYLSRSNNFFNTNFIVKFTSIPDARYLSAKEYSEISKYLKSNQDK